MKITDHLHIGLRDSLTQLTVIDSNDKHVTILEIDKQQVIDIVNALIGCHRLTNCDVFPFDRE